MTHRNAHINVQQFEAVTPGTLKLEGATINATDVKIVANALLMKSLRDTQNGRHKSISGGIDVNLSNGAVSGHVEGSRGSYSKANVNEQTGIKALGEFIAEIGDVTHLQGAFIDAANGALKTNRLIHSDIDEHDQSKQMDFGVGNFDFSRNSAYILPDVSYNSKNKKGRLKAGVSSGVQIVTQSDISNLNRDLSRAREVVKDHKHHVRVVVPIPTSEKAFQAIGDFIQNIFASAETRQERREAASYRQIFDDIQERNDLTESEKAQAYQAASDILNQMKDIQFETEQLQKDIAEIEGLEYKPKKEEVDPLRIKGKWSEDGTCLEVFVTRGVLLYKYKNGTLHAVAKKIRHVQDAYEDFKESQPKWLRNTLNAAMGVAGFCAGGPLKKIGQKLSVIVASEILHAGSDNLLEAIEHSESDQLKALETKLAITRKDTLTFAGLFLGIAVYKATPGGGSKGALKAEARKQAKTPKVEFLAHSKIAQLRDEKSTYALAMMLKGHKFEWHHIMPQKFAGHEVWKLAGTHINDKMNLIPLPRKETEVLLKTKSAIHRGGHSKEYNEFVEKGLDKIKDNGEINNWTESQYKKELHNFMDKLGEKLLKGDKHVNKAGERYYHEIYPK